MKYWLLSEEHSKLRSEIREYVNTYIEPYAEQWEQEGRTPRSLFEDMGEKGMLGLKIEKKYGGQELGFIADAIFIEELSRCSSGGVAAAIGAHSNIAMTAIWKYGNDHQKQKYLIPSVKGEMIAALGITEPNAGSDVASIATVAKQDGDQFIISGSKVFITNGVHGDYVVVAAKTNPAAGTKGVSMFIVETKTPGFIVTSNLKKLGWRASDTAELSFEEMRVSKENLIGEINKGFYYIMANFQWERIWLALFSIGTADRIYNETLELLGQDRTHLTQQQAILDEIRIDIYKARALTYQAVYLYEQDHGGQVVQASMAKAYACEMVNRVAEKSIDLLGIGSLEMSSPIQRMWRDARLQSIGGGTTQIMNEILAKRLNIL